MDENNTLGSLTPPQSPPPRGDKVEVIKVLILAIVSFLGGFALVFIFLRPPSTDDEPELPDEEEAAAAQEEAAQQDEAPRQHVEEPSGSYGGYAPSAPGQAAADEGAAEPSGGAAEEQAANEGDAPAEVPPGRTPDGVAIDGDAFYLKCWDSEGQEKKGSDCDKLEVFEKRFSTRLYVVDECRITEAGSGAQGKLSVAAEVDFAKGSVSFWSGASSEIKSASQIGSCLREKLAGLPIDGVDHRYDRYRVFHTVLFGKAAEKAAEPDAPSAPAAGKAKGRPVNVIKDRVRVRKAPVDGDVIGKISTGNQVRFIKKQGAWCNIVTPNDNEGWMICDALEL